MKGIRSADATMYWVVLEPHPKDAEEPSPEWIRRIGMDASGRLYVSAAVLGDEDQALQEFRETVVPDSLEGVFCRGHLYLSLDWLMQARPHRLSSWLLLRSKARTTMFLSFPEHPAVQTWGDPDSSRIH